MNRWFKSSLLHISQLGDVVIFQEDLLDLLVNIKLSTLNLFCVCLLSGICFINLNTMFNLMAFPTCSIQYLFFNGCEDLCFNKALYTSFVFMVLDNISVVVLTVHLHDFCTLAGFSSALGWTRVEYVLL